MKTFETIIIMVYFDAASSSISFRDINKNNFVTGAVANDNDRIKRKRIRFSLKYELDCVDQKWTGHRPVRKNPSPIRPPMQAARVADSVYQSVKCHPGT